MYRLEMYFNEKWNMLGRFYEQSDLINIMNLYSLKYNCYLFNIIEVLDNTPYLYKTIRNEEELKEITYEYKVTNDIEDLSCVDLKRLILKGKKL